MYKLIATNSQELPGWTKPGPKENPIDPEAASQEFLPAAAIHPDKESKDKEEELTPTLEHNSNIPQTQPRVTKARVFAAVPLAFKPTPRKEDVIPDDRKKTLRQK
jgi:hypothetical protein